MRSLEPMISVLILVLILDMFCDLSLAISEYFPFHTSTLIDHDDVHNVVHDERD